MNNYQLDHINLKVKDLEKTITYYTDLLGFEVSARFMGPNREFVFITNGEITYELLEYPDIEVGFVDHLAYISKDINKDYMYFKKLGLTTTEVGFIDFLFDKGVNYFFIEGTNGEKIEFCERVK